MSLKVTQSPSNQLRVQEIVRPSIQRAIDKVVNHQAKLTTASSKTDFFNLLGI